MTVRIGDRYELTHPLGEGGQAVVWAAQDRLAAREVALKWYHQSTPLAAPARRELRLHQLLHVPGLARLLDHGEADGRPYLVMERVPGEPFTQPGARQPWPALAPRLARLLRVLERLHAEGLIHRDLKPANVLVSADGSVNVLDLGLAEGRLLPREGGGAPMGSPPYVAPELLEGEAPTARSDLFAIGVMAFEALSGQPPWPDPGAGPLAWVAVARRQAPRRLRALGVELPPELETLIEALIHPAPGERPASAAEALGWLERALPQIAPIPLPPGEVLRPEDLATIFAGPSRLLHLPEDAAAELFRRTRGARDAVARELLRWELDGSARREGDRLHLSREDLARLAAASGRRLDPAGPLALPADLDADRVDLLAWTALAWPAATPALLAELVADEPARVASQLRDLQARGLLWLDEAGAAEDRTGGAALSRWSPSERGAAHGRLARLLPVGPLRLRHHLAANQLGAAADVALPQARRMAADGQLDGALGLLDQVARWMHDEGDARRERAALRELSAVALMSESAAPLRRAAWARGRAIEPAPVTSLIALVEAAQAAVSNQLPAAHAALARAEASMETALATLQPGEHEVLRSFDVQLWTVKARLADLEGPAALAALLEDRVRWAQGDEDRRARWLGWRGWLAYREGRYEEAAALHLEAADKKSMIYGQIASRLSAAAALLEAGDFDGAERVAVLAASQAAALRITMYEAQAAWMGRAAAYRARRVTGIDRDLIAAARAVDLHRPAGLLLLTEAAIAWRAGQEDAIALAEEAVSRLDRVGAQAGAALALALASHMRAERGSPPPEPVRPTRETWPPGVRLQILALRGLTPDDAPTTPSDLVARLPIPHLDRRLEILSPAECLVRCA